ncbi:MAG: winged helix-turn-helix domain-containing protein [Candidatus Omnitrophica bacterium]|nr:winged helix-turn-helix domain-containing protein [Candidatus Omnitrophota bacterium]
MMMTKLGIISGEILTLLEEKKRPLRFKEIDEYIDEPRELIDMSLGWLTREGLTDIEWENDQDFIVIDKHIHTEQTTN